MRKETAIGSIVLRRISAAVAVCVGVGSAEAKSPEYTPPRLLSHSIEFRTCRAPATPGDDQPPDAQLSLEIGGDGSVAGFTLQDGAPSWMKEISDCVVQRIRFDPARRKGKPVESSADLTVLFVTEEGQDGNLYRPLAWGPLLTPPNFVGSPGRVFERCIPSGAWDDGLNHVVMRMTVAPNGSVDGITVPVGSPTWIEDLAECLKKGLRFFPGTRDGVPVSAEVSTPFQLHGEYFPGSVSVPKPLTDASELEAAYRACYPSDLNASGSVHFSFDLAGDGQPSKIKVVRSSGDTRLDRVAACVLPRLRFSPLKHGTRVLESRITWELPMRPPK